MLQKPAKQERSPSCFQHRDEKMKVKMAEQTADLIELLVAMVASDSILSIWHQHGKKRSNLVKSEYFGCF